jgi:hypothetical protein
MNPIAPVFFVYLGIIAWLFQRRTQWLTRFGVFTVLLGGLFVSYGVAVPFSDGVNPTLTYIAISPERLADYYVAVFMAYAGIYLGMWALDVLRTGRERTQVGTVAATDVLAVGAALIIAIVFIAWIVIPWTDFVQGISSFLPGHSAADYRLHRIQYGAQTTNFGSAFGYIGSFTRFALAPVMLWILFFHRKRSRLLSAMFWLLFAILLVIGLLSGQKQPALLLIVGFAVALLIQRGRPSILSWRLAAVALVLVGVVAPTLYLAQYPTLDFAAAIQLTLYRLTEEPSRVAQLRFIFYPDIHPYLNGLSSYILRGFATLLGIDTNAAQSPETYIPASSPGVGPNYGGTWNAGFFADAWADFGFVGVTAGSFAVGFLVRAIDRWYSASGKGAVEMGVYTAVCISALYVSEVGTLTALWTYGLGSAFLMYFLLKLLRFERKPLETLVPLNPRWTGVPQGSSHTDPKPLSPR